MPKSRSTPRFNPCFALPTWSWILCLSCAAGCDFGAAEKARQAAQQAAMREAEARAMAESARAIAEQSRATPSAPASSSALDLSGLTPEQRTATGLTAADIADGWLALFDGHSLFGWQPATKANWQVREGAIEVSSGEPGLLCTTSSFSDYALRLEFKFAPGANSGVFLHTPAKPTDPAADCYELNIAELAVSPFPTGSFVKREKAEATAAPNVWHAFEVTALNDEFTVKLNGQTVLEYRDPQPLRRGLIGLQLNQGAVAFRKIHLKPLGLTSLIQPPDLASSWTDYPEQKAKFHLASDGLLHVAGGRGQLESKARFGDFVLRFDCRTNAPNLNSGVFFRCLPGEEMLGYECQIHNGFQGDDREKPVDCGTGGIFRRHHARRIVANDKTWFTTTLVADGPHIAAWVNGYQVSDWTDNRPADPNPRKGLRTEPGTLMLQGHDPTTDIDFRAIAAQEMAQRNSPAAASGDTPAPKR